MHYGSAVFASSIFDSKTFLSICKYPAYLTVCHGISSGYRGDLRRWYMIVAGVHIALIAHCALVTPQYRGGVVGLFLLGS